MTVPIDDLIYHHHFLEGAFDSDDGDFADYIEFIKNRFHL
jgi:hypothetical protein